MYYDRWEIQRYIDRKLPSKNDLEKLLNYGIINPDTYRREMRKLGYSWEQTEWYLRLAKAKVKPAEERKKIKKLSVTQLKQSYIDGDITREEFKQYLSKVTIHSIYFHMFEARMRLKKEDNDFSCWLRDAGFKSLAYKISKLDPYTYTLEGLRRQIIELVEQEIENEKNR